MISLTHNHAERQPRYIEENPDLKVYPIDCVPHNRPKGSWTNGVKAWTKDGKCEGWFFPPRMRNKGHHTRSGPKPRRNLSIALQEEE